MDDDRAKASKSGAAADGDDMTMRERFKDPERRVELIATVLMSIAIVCSAYCAWQATRWGGVQATAFAEASAARIESGKAVSTGVQQTAYDASALLQLSLAYSEGATQTAADFADRFVRDEFRPYLDEWLALDPLKNPDAASTPFELESYANAEIERGRALEATAALFSGEAKDANQTGDDYILATVYFASVLFFAGVSTKLDDRTLRWAILLLAAAGLAFGLTRTLTLPFY